RHTRSDRDWSSDVCSSDLIAFIKKSTPLILNWIRKSFCTNSEALYPASTSVEEKSCFLFWENGAVNGFEALTINNPLVCSLNVRSEERRVGKECKCRRERE